jgi:release factor glutamine methyltransferase
MQTTLNTLRQLLTPHYGQSETNALIRLLVQELCGLDRTQMLAHPERRFSSDERERLLAAGQRLAQGEPIQYILGYEWFAGRRFEVSAETLIPRPETAELVQWILDDGAQCSTGTAPEVWDVGTGSGCIALSVAAEWNDASVTAIDLSAGALEVARRNAQRLGLDRVRFLQKDFLKLAETENEQSYQQMLITCGLSTSPTLIVSNPPYIRQREAAEMSHNVLDYEPHSALFVPNDDPLLFYRALARVGRRSLVPGGHLYVEINEALGNETAALFAEAGLIDVTLRRDADGRDRMIRCQQPQTSATSNL